MSINGSAENNTEMRGELSIPKAIRGKNAYELAVMIGFKGTLEEWIDSLKLKYGDLTDEEIAELVANVADSLLPKVVEIKDELVAAVADNASRAETAQAAAETAAESALSSYADAQISARLASDHKDEANTAKTAAQAAQSKAETAQSKAEEAQSAATGAKDEIMSIVPNIYKSASNAKTSETNAKASEDNAKASENKAKASENNAKTSENNAVYSASAADESAFQARNYLDLTNTAKQEAEAAAGRAETAANNAESAAVNAVKASIEQATGNSTEKTMSQKAITDYVVSMLASFEETLYGAIAKISSVTLLVDNWEGEASPYHQAVTISGATENSKIDLNPTIEQLNIFHNKDIAFVVENNNGAITVYCIGQKPTNDYTIQTTITEVAIDG